MEVIVFLLIIYSGISVAYYGTFSLAALGYRESRKKWGEKKKANHFAILIPAYKEDAVILDTVENVLNQNYPSIAYDVVVIADSLRSGTIEKLRKCPVILLEVKFKKSSKVKALNQAVKLLSKSYDIALILDADNHIEPDFLKKINFSYNQGHQIIQAHRTAKNLDTSFACLDAISEEINNSIFRKGHQVLGLSSALIGSGIAMNYEWHKEYMASMQALGGFDKELELNVLRDQKKIKYLANAWIYDEKVPNAEVFEKQRTRWIAAQIRYGLKYFTSAWYHLLRRGNIDYFDKVFQFLLPPRLILLGVLGVALIISFLLGHESVWVWVILLGTNLLSLFLAIPLRFYRWDVLLSFLSLPKALYRMLVSLFKLRKAKHSFLHTPHSTSTK